MLAVGTVVDGHKIEEVLGEGGMATVYGANELHLYRTVVLKVFSPSLCDDPSFQERFEQEWLTHALLQHPNVLTLFRAGPSEYGPWLTMRWMRKGTLRDLLRAKPPSPEDALGLLDPIADALDEAHEAGVVHRDLTPGNIFVSGFGEPFLSDFGITGVQEARRPTGAGQFRGTIDYLAPEQVQGELGVPATDTYALAAILFHCLTGRVPFERDSAAAAIGARVEGEPPVPSEVDGTLSPAIDPVLLKGLARRPEDRYQRPSELIAAAREALRGGFPPQARR